MVGNNNGYKLIGHVTTTGIREVRPEYHCMVGGCREGHRYTNTHGTTMGIQVAEQAVVVHTISNTGRNGQVGASVTMRACFPNGLPLSAGNVIS